MALENFLINPARIRRKRRVKSRRGRRKALPGKLLSRMMRTHGPRRGMKEAWKAFRKGVTRNEPGLGLLGLASNRRRTRSRRRRLSNPFGEEVMVVGNPKRRRRKKTRARVRRPRRRSFLKRILGGLGRIRRPRRRRRARVARNQFFANPRRRRYRRRRRSIMLNPRRKGRRGRRGGAVAAALPALSFMKPMQLLVPLAVGTAGYMAADRVPDMAKISGTLPRLGVKAAVGIGGGMLIGKFLGRQNAAVWTIGVGINLLSDLLKTYVFKTQLISAAGYGAFPYQEYGAYPDEFSGYPTAESYPY